MNILIAIENEKVIITLKNKREAVGRAEFVEERNLLEKLLPAIDALLKKHKITPPKVKKITVKTDLHNSSTTKRIAETVAKTWNWAVDKNKT